MVQAHCGTERSEVRLAPVDVARFGFFFVLARHRTDFFEHDDEQETTIRDPLFTSRTTTPKIYWRESQHGEPTTARESNGTWF